MEETKKKKDTIKNIAIIFLSIMLLLTLFSNTIMNYTLPQVSTTYANQGTVSEQIKGSGTVDYAQKYEVKIDSVREIEKVLVKKGDKVTAGDKLFTLALPKTDEADPEDYRDDSKVVSAKSTLDTAKQNVDDALITLSDLEYAYQKLLDTPDTSTSTNYSSELLEIENAKKQLQDYKDLLVLVESGKDPLSVATEEYNKLKAEQDEKTRQKEKYTNMLSSVDTTEMLNLSEPIYNRIVAAQDKITRMENALAEAQEHQKKVTDENSSNTASQDENIAAKRKEITALRGKIDIEYTKINGTAMNPEDMDSYYNTVSAYNSNIASYEAQISVLHDEIEELMVKNAKSKQAKDLIAAEAKKVKKADQDLKDAKKALSDLKREIKLLIKKRIDNLTNELYELQPRVDAANNKKTEAGTTVTMNASQLRTKIQDQELAITKLETELEKKYDTDAKTNEKNAKDGQTQIRDKAREIEKQRDKITTLRSKLSEAEMDYNEAVQRAKEKIARNQAKKAVDTEITAKISGEIADINVTEGSQTESGKLIATINVVDLGLQVEMPCKQDQARKVRVGDMAQITSWYTGDDFEATLKEIKSDPNNQTQKILVFSIKGTDITPGQTISLAMGSKGQSYSTVIPNRAFREDSNGSYVFVLESKATPLGNRYTAVRVSVEKIAQDDNNTAVNGLAGGEFIITTTNKPVSPGEQVRLAESGT
ncbi:MAG: HlyD family efflux transporter periplasmic adaptor subunit [Oscillospiraceae bacterium]|nr:HlyD family efflux transporter periplasmic adaptor subunit [Oscillospiraceae bacterium]